jgi:hypothetical protein
MRKGVFLYQFQLHSQISFTLIDYIFWYFNHEIVILKYILKM